MRKSGYRFTSLAAATALSLLAPCGGVMAGPWDMDMTYGDGGMLAIDTGAAVQVRALPDGTLREVTGTTAGIVLRHRGVNGKPDSTYGVDGQVEITFPAGFSPYDNFPLVDSNGRLLWCGALDTNNDKLRDRAILRYTPAGELDPAFGAGGMVSHASAPFPGTNNGAFGDRCDSLALQPDGRIVATVARYEAYYDFADSLTLLRFNQDGSTDSTFGGGTGAVPVPTYFYEGGSNVLVLPDGRITVFRGDKDITFDVSGTSVSGPKDNPSLPRPSYIYSDPIEWQVLAIPGSSDILLVGNDNGESLLVVRERSDGSITSSFGPFHLSISTLGNIYSFVTASLSQDGMRLYVVRSDRSSLGEPGGGEIMRLIVSGARAGQIDPDFGVGGRVYWPFPWFTLSEQSQGNVLLIGAKQVLRLSVASGLSPGVMGFTSDGNAIGLEDSPYTLRVVRAAGHDGVAEVAYHTVDYVNSGIAGVNYESAAGRLQWGDGDSDPQLVTLRLLRGAASVLPAFFLRLDSAQGAMLLADEVVIGVKGASPSPASAPPASAPPPIPTQSEPVTSGGGSMDPISLLLLLLLLLGGGAALRARVRSSLN